MNFWSELSASTVHEIGLRKSQISGIISFKGMSASRQMSLPHYRPAGSLQSMEQVTHASKKVKVLNKRKIVKNQTAGALLIKVEIALLSLASCRS